MGLRIAPPEAPVSGYRFGNGIYLADCSSKAADYCYSTETGGEALRILCEAELGNMQTLGKSECKVGPRKWVDAGIVHPSLKGVKMPSPNAKVSETGTSDTELRYNEYICYDVAQIRLRYLLYVKIKKLWNFRVGVIEGSSENQAYSSYT
ncbi:hypothetical protein FANTH_13364 [Fusarium anthophilum]|uniref:Poly [ADP-ribose] polymerase n=1 Tax=Fusarium anthophilum TaxID=48485 RepID=A0A8H4YP17_9HYPO|nr:hypothetical protein FANTH_13364 [Fusarium anthophilum]